MPVQQINEIAAAPNQDKIVLLSVPNSMEYASHFNCNKRRQRGFTIPEMLAVVAITVIILAMLLPALRKAKDSTHIVQCQSVMHQCALAHRSYALDRRGWYMMSTQWGGTKNNKYDGITYNRYWATDHEFLPYINLRTDEFQINGKPIRVNTAMVSRLGLNGQCGLTVPYKVSQHTGSKQIIGDMS
jgi:prepilin-type N-terminal cleavage/methylation domain-containing protein